MTKQERMALIQKINPGETGMPKMEILYGLALQADGPIAEVGCGKGIGTVALACGSMDGGKWPVYAFDPFEEVRGWAGESYGPWLKEVWFENVMAAGALPIVQSVMLPVDEYDGRLDFALTFWDLGRVIDPPLDQWLYHWIDWHVPVGGIVAINETGDGSLRVDEWTAAHGELVELLSVQYYIRIVRKR